MIPAVVPTVGLPVLEVVVGRTTPRGGSGGRNGGAWVGLALSKTAATWREIERRLYLPTVPFVVLESPTATLHGVWRGKYHLDWQRERLKIDCRSPKVQSKLEADLSIVEKYRDLDT